MELYPNAINTRYKTDISPEDHLPGHELLERVGRKRGMLISGGEVNTERAAITVLDEYRGGQVGAHHLGASLKKGEKPWLVKRLQS